MQIYTHSHSIMPRTLKSVKQAEAIPNRHCKYVSAAAHAIPFKTTLDLARRPAWMAEPYSKAAEQELFKQKANIHVGQRKLLLSEVQLLTMYYKRNTIHPTVVYVGAAPGHHIRFLHILFPKIEFILYDGAPYEPALRAAAASTAANKAKIYELHNSFFTDDTCREIAARKLQKLIFISDIRMGEDNKNRFEDLVGRDNAAQRGWVNILKPAYSLLKFRLPYSLKHGQKMSYVKGKIMYQVWPPMASGETRLLVHKDDIKKEMDYDFKTYEEALFYHNRWTRRYCFVKEAAASAAALPLANHDTDCPCYDCVAEKFTWLDYLKLNRERTGASATDRRLASIGAILKEASKPEYRLQSDSISPKGAPALEILDARRRIA
jgi:hypothetical protein